jgi:hypothetical protein
MPGIDYNSTPQPKIYELPSLGPLAFPDPVHQPAFTPVVYIQVTYDDGSRSRGSGVFVGQNDVLTAAHVVAPPPGGTVTDIDIFPAFDSGSRGPWGSFTTGQWIERHIPITIEHVSDGSRIDLANAASDIALVGISQSLGRQYGISVMAPGPSFPNPNEAPQTGFILGYPAERGTEFTYSSGPMDLRWASYGSEFGNPIGSPVWDISQIYHNRGSSGGPVFDASGRVVGVVSTTEAAARIDAEWDLLQTWMSENDNLLTGAAQNADFMAIPDISAKALLPGALGNEAGTPAPESDKLLMVSYTGVNGDTPTSGSFVEVAENTWVENGLFHFEEVSETDEHITLFDASRGVTVEMDMLQGNVSLNWGDNTLTWSITDVSHPSISSELLAA